MCEPVATAGSPGSRTFPSDERVANSILAHRKTFGGCKILQPRAGAKIVRRKDDARDCGAGGVGLDARERRERLEFVEETGFVDLDLHGWRYLFGSQV